MGLNLPGDPRLPPAPKSVGPPILAVPKGPQPAQRAQQQADIQAAAYRGPANPRPVLAPQQTSRPSPGGDVQSGGGYGVQSAQAQAYKQTAGYKQAIVDTFFHQPKPQATAIVSGALTSSTYEGKLVLDYLKSEGMGASLSGGSGHVSVANPFSGDSNLGSALTKGIGGLASLFLPHQSDLQKLTGQIQSHSGLSPTAALRAVAKDAAGTLFHQSDLQKLTGQIGGPTLQGVAGAAANAVGSQIHPSNLQQITGQIGGPTTGADLANTGLGLAQKGLKRIQPGPGPAGQLSQAGVGGGALGRVIVNAPIDVARATLQSPSVIPKTISGLGNLAVGGLAGLSQIPVDIAQQKALSPVASMVQAMLHDYAQRYGPVAAGHDQQFIDRIKKQGASSELLDALGFVGSTDATVGRAAADIAKARDAATGKAGFLTRERPGLRISGGEVRPQQLARGALKITAQRVEDRLRAARGTSQGVQLRPGEVAPLASGRATRVLISGTAAKTRRLMQNALNTEVRHGAEPALRTLSPWEKKAFGVAIEGTIPLRSGPEAAVHALEAQKQMIIAERAGNKLSPGNLIPAQHAAQVDNLNLLTDLRAHVKEAFTPKLANLVDSEAQRSIRLEKNDLRLSPGTAEARRLRAQGETLGIPHPDEAVAKQIADLQKKLTPIRAVIDNPGTVGELKAARAAFERTQASIAELRSGETRPAQLAAYSAQVRAIARERGLPEPGFLHHQGSPKVDFGAYTSQGHAAMPGAKQSKFSLFKGGAVDRSTQAYVDGLAKSIKAAHQWPLVDEQFRRNALPTPSADAIRAALGHGKHASLLTGHELSQVLAHQGFDLSKLKFYNPGRLAAETMRDHELLTPAREKAVFGSRVGGVPPEMEANGDFAHALDQNSVAQDGKLVKGGKGSPEFLTTAGWKALSRPAFDELHSSLQPSGTAGRVVGKIQGGTAGLILGGSPSFVIMNSLAHAVLATFGTRGRLLTDAAKFPMWWHGAPADVRNIVDANAGGRGAFRIERLGSTAPTQLAASWQALKQTGIIRAAGHLNPLRVLLKAEDLQSNFFRRMVMYHATKQEALQSMGRDMSLGANAANRLQHVFTVGPKDRMNAILRSQPAAEALGRHTVNMMGDYARFTSRERKWINNRSVLFYSFIRHAARTLFYVLPFKHPIITALTAEIAKLHNDEVKKLLGGQNLPWAYSRLFFHGKDGKLSSVDLMRASPVGSASTDVATQGVGGLAQMIAPEVLPILNMIEGQTPTGAPFQRNGFSLANSLLSLSYPYRLGTELHFGLRPQQADSIPFLHERPDIKKTKAAQAYQAAKVAASGPNEQKILAGLLGLYPKPDDTAVIAANRNAKAAAHARKLAGKGSSSGAWQIVSGGAPQTTDGGGGWQVVPSAPGGAVVP